MNFRQLLLFTSIAAICLEGSSNAQVKYDMVVASDGSGDYKTVQAAFNAVPKNSSSRTVIYIKNGTYKENLTLTSDRKNVTIIGQSRDDVKLTYDNYSGKVVNGVTLSTSTSSSTYIKSEGFCAINISFENSSGPVGQAVAIYITGDKSIFYNCRFLGRQDTWYGDRCRQFIRKCYIEGSTDFLFGPSTAWIDSCQIYSYGGSALTAASTEQYVTYGYVFRYCSISGASGVSTTLGRPWRPYSAVSFLNCSMTSCIKAAGWDNWGNIANESTARYSEYKNTGSGASTTGRVTWAKQLTDAQAQNYTFSNVLKSTYANPPAIDNWNPLSTLDQYTSNSSGTIHKIPVKSENFGLSILMTKGKSLVLQVSGIVGANSGRLYLYDLCGRVVFKKQIYGFGKVSFELPEIKNGIYMVGVESCGHKIHKQITIR